MPIAVMCPSCGHSGRTADAYVGRTVRCKKCSAEFRVSPAFKEDASIEPAKIASATTVPLPQTRNPFPRDPLAYARDRGHAEFPCLSKTYSPGSRVPCADFSPWLYERIRADDADTIADFVWSIVQANPGAGAGDEVFRKHWKDLANRILGFRLDRYLRIETPETYIELRAALVLILLHDNFGGFVMAGDAARYLATVMLPYVFKTIDEAELITRANWFIRHMRKDTPFWQDFPLFEPSAFDSWTQARPKEVTEFCQILRTLPLATRKRFFDIPSPNDTRQQREASRWTKPRPMAQESAASTP